MNNNDLHHAAEAAFSPATYSAGLGGAAHELVKSFYYKEIAIAAECRDDLCDFEAARKHDYAAEILWSLLNGFEEMLKVENANGSKPAQPNAKLSDRRQKGLEMTTETQSAVRCSAWLDDIRDAKRYRHLRQTAYRSHTGKGTGRRYKVEMHFVAPQRDQWPDQHAFCDFDSAVDEAMSSNAKLTDAAPNL